VPKVKGKTKAAARSALTHAHCALGRVKGKGKVKKQSPAAGKTGPAGTKVALTLAKR
jgi:beta-lactam-binding protein with PASTA domain